MQTTKMSTTKTWNYRMQPGIKRRLVNRGFLIAVKYLFLLKTSFLIQRINCINIISDRKRSVEVISSFLIHNAAGWFKQSALLVKCPPFHIFRMFSPKHCDGALSFMTIYWFQCMITLYVF